MSIRRGVAVLGLLLSSVAAAETTRFEPKERLRDERADWLSVDGDRVASGFAHRVFLTSSTGAVEIDSELRLAVPVSEAVLAGDRLYLNEEGRRVSTVRLDSASEVPVTVELAPPPVAELRIVRMDDYLVVAEEGFGLRILALPPPPAHHHPAHPSAPQQIAAIPVSPGEPIAALAASVRRIYLATGAGMLHVIDAQRTEAPALVSSIEIGPGTRAMAANGSTLALLEPEGLRLVEITEDGNVVTAGVFPELAGSSIALAGRSLLLAAGERGLQSFVDRTPLAATHFVAISNFTFTPSNVTIDVGDTVQWENMGGLHNVESCDGVADPAQCGGLVAAQGSFTSGDPSSAPFVFSQTFTELGDNPYFCVVHVGLGMTGNVAVSAAPTPPGVPDGTTGTPLLVRKGTSNGSTLILLWDDSTCTGITDHQVIYGLGASLPTLPGGIYTPADGLCAIGAPPFLWNPVPNPAADPQGLLWFLVLATDGPDLEGSWGADSFGDERKGPGPNGFSGLCVQGKDFSSSCP